MNTTLGSLVLGMCVLVGACAQLSKEPPFPPAAKAGEGIVYIYRDLDRDARQTPFVIEEDALVIGTLQQGSFFYRRVSPGRHYYSAYPVGQRDASAGTGAFVRVTAGGTYYVQTVPQPTADGGMQALVFAKFAAQAKPALDKLKYTPSSRRENALRSPPQGAEAR